MGIKIETKIEMYELLRSGVLGNCMRIWDNKFEVEMSGYTGPIGLRSAAAGGGMWKGHNTLEEASRLQKELAGRGIRTFLCEEAPNHLCKLNAEICRTPQGYHMKYGTGPGYMRDVLKKPKYAFGEQAQYQVSFACNGIPYVCDNPYWDHLVELMDTYDGPLPQYQSAVVEFSIYGESCGMLNQPFVVWEVRSY